MHMFMEYWYMNILDMYLEYSLYMCVCARIKLRTFLFLLCVF